MARGLSATAELLVYIWTSPVTPHSVDCFAYIKVRSLFQLGWRTQTDA